MKKGYVKHKGKLPLKCFLCRRVGHYASKFPYPNLEDSDDEREHKNIGNIHKIKKRISLKIFFFNSNKDGSSS